MSNKTTDMRPPHLRPESPAVDPEGGPFVDPRIDPGAMAYAQRIAQRRQANVLPKGGQPVGGPPTPSIPRLDAPHQQGMTMAQQAAPQPQQQPLGPGIVETPLDPRLQGPPNQQQQRTQLQLQPGDMLPPEALKDPQAMTGPGSAAAAAQPYLAARYGVIRGGQRIAAQSLVPSGKERTLSPETLAGMQAITEAQKQSQLSAPSDAEPPMGMPRTEEEAAAGFDEHPAASSQKAGEPDDVQNAINDMDSFDYSQLRDRAIQDILNRPEQKKIVEDRLKPLEIDDLILKNRVSQDVPIIPTTANSRGFTVRYTSMSGEEELELKRLVMVEANSIEVTERYLLDKFAFMAITCGLAAINGNAAPSHLDEQGRFNEEKFWKKFDWVMKRPVHMLSSIGVHHTYFEMRVRKLFVAEKLGNG